jgi:hypothetical protein
MVLALGMRFFVNMTVGAYMLFVSEMLPTGLRARGNAIVHLSFSLAIMPSPFIIHLVCYRLLIMNYDFGVIF